MESNEMIEVREIDLGAVFRKVFRHWKMMLIWSVLGALLGFGIAKSIPRTYTVVSKVSPELSYRQSSITSLAAMAGITNNMLNNTEALLPTVYPDIISSPEFMIKLLGTQVNSEKCDTTLYGYLSTCVRQPWWNVVLSLPFKAISALTSPKDDAAAEDSLSFDAFKLTKEQAGIVKSLSRCIDVSVDKRTYLITISVEMQDRVVAAQTSRALLAHLEEFVRKYRTDKTRKDLAFFEEMYEEAKSDYYEAQKKLSWYVDSHQGFVLQSAKIEQQRLQNDVNLKYQLFTSLSQQVQNARLRVQQDTPVFAQIVAPTVPVRKSGPSTVKIMAFLFLLAFVVSALVYLRK